jgi:DNA-binding CsgD family transcriptional regulator/PAS domain-containing protein
MKEIDDADAVLAAIAEIYSAVGDEKRLRDLEARFGSAGISGESLRADLELAKGITDQTCTLRQNRDLFAALHDQLTAGVVIVDPQGSILRANAAARILLEAGIGVGSADGCLRIGDATAAVALSRALNEASGETHRPDGPVERTIPIVRPGHRPLIMYVVGRITSQACILERPPETVLMLLDPEGPASANLALLQELYGLTAREATVAALVVEGRSLDEASRELGVTKHTVRTLLKRATAKTNSHGQTDLVRRLLGLSLVLLD